MDWQDVSDELAQYAAQAATSANLYTSPGSPLRSPAPGFRPRFRKDTSGFISGSDKDTLPLETFNVAQFVSGILSQQGGSLPEQTMGPPAGSQQDTGSPANPAMSQGSPPGSSVPHGSPADAGTAAGVSVGVGEAADQGMSVAEADSGGIGSTYHGSSGVRRHGGLSGSSHGPRRSSPTPAASEVRAPAAMTQRELELRRQMNKRELQAICREHGLQTTGNKPDLIQRIVAHELAAEQTA